MTRFLRSTSLGRRVKDQVHRWVQGDATDLTKEEYIELAEAVEKEETQKISGFLDAYGEITEPETLASVREFYKTTTGAGAEMTDAELLALYGAPQETK